MDKFEAIVRFFGEYHTAFEAESYSEAYRMAEGELSELMSQYEAIDIYYRSATVDADSSPDDIPEEI